MAFVLSKRSRNSHKSNYGRLAIVAGSRGMTGAAYLSASSALRTGSGLVYLYTPASLEELMSLKLVEAIVRPVEDCGKGHFVRESGADILRDMDRMDVLAIGPGLGQGEERFLLLKDLLRNLSIPMVIDADAINLLARDKTILKEARSKIVITPHEGELGRFLGKSPEEIRAKREYYASYTAEKYGLIVVLKGSKTLVVSEKLEIYENTTGNPGMATAGSGDVLTGIIASLIGQGMEAYKAASLGVYIHGLAGDLAAEDKGEYGLIARDIIDKLPYGLKQLMEK